MSPYVYQPLEPKQIRILRLQAGSHNDPIRIFISHVSLTPPESAELSHPKLSHTNLSDTSSDILQQLQKDLPREWSVHETLEGRHLFYHRGVGAERFSSWEHPNASPAQTALYDIQAVPETTLASGWEAVSYCWGSLAITVDIHVVESLSPLNSTGTLEIGSNLHELLLELRHPDKTRSLWIDAICINQGDTDERSLQVQEMRSIYKYAYRVVVWLGSRKDDSTLALLSLEYLGQQLEITKREIILPAPHQTEPDWWDHTSVPNFDNATLKAIGKLVLRPYFERLWIMQELQLANERSIIRCGKDEVLWYHLRRGLAKCTYYTNLVPGFYHLEAKMEHVNHLSLGLETLSSEKLFDTTSKCACSDPRDKIYGIIGLFPPALASRITPDYSTPVHKVYIDTFVDIAVLTWRLNFLGSYHEDAPPDLPSWVPSLLPSNDWRMVTGEDCASGASPCSGIFYAPNEFHVLGRFIDTVTGIGLTGSSTFKSSYEAALELMQAIPDQNVHGTPEAKLDALHWTLAMGQYRDKWTQTALPTLEEARDFFQHMLEDTMEQVPAMHHAWCRQVKTDVEFGQVFVTSHGIFGYTSSAVLPGDKLVVLLGCELPTLLRVKSIEAETVKSHVIGKSYVHGLMEAQALLDALPPPWKVVYRTLAPMYVSRRITYPLFENTETGVRTLEDPRLEPLPEEWEEVKFNPDWRYAFRVMYYQNKKTKQIINSDPRLAPDRLIERGVPLEKIILI